MRGNGSNWRKGIGAGGGRTATIPDQSEVPPYVQIVPVTTLD
jgi:hypothetical protein